MPGAPFLQAMVPWAVKKFSFDADKFVHELVDSIIGDHYPVPDRMLVHNEQIVHEYLRVGDVRQTRGRRASSRSTRSRAAPPPCATSSSRSRANRILNPGDTIALGVPIFTPYLEMAHLEDYDLHLRRGPREAGEPVSVSGRRAREAPRSEDQGVLHRQPGQPVRGGALGDDDQEDRRHPQEAARSDPADRRRLRHVRARASAR